MNSMKLFSRILLIAVISLPLISSGQEMDEMLDMSLEDLMNIEITSVSKKSERLQDVASSIYVLSAEDIENSNATTLHEVLRLVPGYWGVQDEYSNAQANIRYSQVENALTGTVLYLLDGTPIQDQMFSSFNHKNFDIPLDEIERIEVIRGSGGTVYGANSATGVVNIFTKDPSKYDGINVRSEAASGGYLATSVRAGGAINEDLAISGYAKMRLFDGFGSLAGTDENGNQVQNSRFTENYDAMDMFSFGLKGNFSINESSKVSFRSHYNTLSTFEYGNYFGRNYAIDGQDVLVGEDVTMSRLVGNLRYDKSFSEDHSMFVRISTNAEDNFDKSGGGYHTSNGMIDFEIQDNFSMGSHDFSIGANYRYVSFDIFDITNSEAVDFLNKQSNEQLIGFFAQDQMSLADDKLKLILGIKGENYSLINDEVYFSPMAKFSFIPTDNFTFWGGFTQSYSTPGFTNTNTDFALFLVPGAASPADVYVKNGSSTVPTEFRTWEAGIRTTIQNQLSFESNIYYTNVSDGIGVTPVSAAQLSESPTRPGTNSTYLLYGNYVGGELYGTESSIKIIPTTDINFEITHSYLKSSWEFTENADFDVNDPTVLPNKDLTLRPAIVPEHVFRFKGDFSLPENITLGLSMIYGTTFNTQGDFPDGNYLVNQERYVNLVIPEPNAVVVGPDSDRTIINIRVEKTWFDGRLSTYAFGNDIFNDGIVANTNAVSNVTRSQIARMIGFGVNYKFK